MGEQTSTFASEKGPPLADIESLKGNRRRELRNEKYPFNCTDFASLNLRIYTPRDAGEEKAMLVFRQIIIKFCRHPGITLTQTVSLSVHSPHRP
jgi:hypothetical protein